MISLLENTGEKAIGRRPNPGLIPMLIHADALYTDGPPHSVRGHSPHYTKPAYLTKEKPDMSEKNIFRF